MLSLQQERNILESLNLQPVERFCTGLLRTPIVFSKEIVKRNDRMVMNIRSQNLADRSGVLSVTLDEVYVVTFGAISVYQDRDDNIKFNCGDLHFAYRCSNDGGRNGHFLANLHIVDKEGQYKFYSVNKELN